MVGQRPVPAASDAGVGAPRVGLFLGRSVLLVVSNWGSDLGAELNDLGMLKWSVGLEIGGLCASWASTPRKVEGFRPSACVRGCRGLRRPGEPHAHTGLYRHGCWRPKDFGFRQNAGFVTRLAGIS
jgi:hypothetical protein